MIFAAGEGRRLRPLTAETPKALVDFGGKPLVERVARRLVGAGASRIIVNAHYLADQVEAWTAVADVGAPVVVSREDGVSLVPLDTCGGLYHAGPLFEARGSFILHNCDVASEVDLVAMCRAHLDGAARDGRLATLAVAERDTGRPLLVDAEGVCGRANRMEGWEVEARAPVGGAPRSMGFAGIHVLSERVFSLSPGTRGSIMEAYMNWIEAGERVGAFDVTGVPWHDIGTPERLAAARAAFGVEGDRGSVSGRVAAGRRSREVGA